MTQLSTVITKIKGGQIARARRFIKLQKFWNEGFAANLTNNCQPITVRSQVLVLATSNSVWTHKLFMEKAEILKQVSAFDKTIKDIQFSVSSPKEIKLLREEFLLPITESLAQKEVPHKNKPQTVEEALSSIIEKDKQIKEQRTNAGWQNCPQCARLFEGKSKVCLDCSNQLQAFEETKIFQRLREVPWTQYETNKNELKVSQRVFIGIKESLKSELKEHLFAIAYGNEKSIKKSQIRKMIRDYVSLKTGMSPAEMTEALVRQTLGKRFSEKLLDNKG